MNRSTQFKLIFLTPIFILLGHYIAVYAHEYAHSFTAWLLGDKTDPWIINFGGTTWQNLLLLLGIDENVDYDKLFAMGQGVHVALIAFAGPGIGNGILFVLTLWLLQDQYIKQHKTIYYFLFWLNFNNLANFYDYVPIRTFSPIGDMAHIAAGLNISPWTIYAVFGYIVTFLMWYFFTRTLIATFINVGIVTLRGRASLMITVVLIMFGYFGLAGFIGNGEISHFLSATSFLAIPGIILAAWPSREWVLRQVNELELSSRC